MATPVLTIWQTLNILMDAGVIYVITHETDKAGNQLEVPQTLYYVFTAPSADTGVHQVVGTIPAQTFSTLFSNKIIWRVPIRGVNSKGEPIAWYRLRKTEYARLGRWPGITTEYIGKSSQSKEPEDIPATNDITQKPKSSFWDFLKRK